MSRRSSARSRAGSFCKDFPRLTARPRGSPLATSESAEIATSTRGTNAQACRAFRFRLGERGLVFEVAVLFFNVPAALPPAFSWFGAEVAALAAPALDAAIRSSSSCRSATRASTSAFSVWPSSILVTTASNASRIRRRSRSACARASSPFSLPGVSTPSPKRSCRRRRAAPWNSSQSLV
jgi:hypothetical protein